MFPVTDTPVSGTIRNFDWSATPLGPIETWSSTLRTIVNLILESKFPKCLVWGGGLVTIHNDAFLPILGDKPSAIGRSFADVWSEAWDTIGPIAEKAFNGGSTYIEDFPMFVDRGSGMEQAHFTFCYSPVRDEQGAIVGMMDTVIETSGAVRARQTEAVLRRELAHRVKNMLAVTGAVVNSTLRHAQSLDDAKVAIGERINALSVAQDFAGANAQSSDLEELIRQVVGPHIADSNRVSLSGPKASVHANQVLALSLVLYELATNAAKYGAMASPDGLIAIEWTTGGDGEFEFLWSETSATPIEAPTRRGFGSQLMTRIGPAYFGGEGVAEYPSSGLRYRLSGRIETVAS
jgi:two-component sensor histidine kinase